MTICICLVATSSAFALFAQLTPWRPDRQSAALTPRVEDEPIPWDDATRSHDRTEIEGLWARNRSDASN
jgi:hypothetical protein